MGKNIMFFIICLVMVLVAVAYSTLLERKILGLVQRRKGPKTSFLGLLQPLADALKLLSKENIIPFRGNYFTFLFIPCFGLIISLILWLLLPLSIYFSFLSVVLYMAVSSFHVYSPILAGWSSNSVYSLLGAVRSIAQTVSYEIPFFCVIMGMSVVKMGYSLDFITSFLDGFFLFMIWMFVVWFQISVVELHRAPFDLSEAESELVSGYNTDYSSFGFVLLFLSEYMNIVFLGQFGVFFFFGSSTLSLFLGVILSSLVLFLRAVYPRVKYNDLMEGCWKGLLPFIFGWFVLIMVLGVFV